MGTSISINDTHRVVSDIECYRDLANAIVIQAAKDYRRALKHLRNTDKPSAEKGIIIECEQFFRSDYFKILTKLDGKRLISMIKEECKNERKARAKHKRAN